MKEPFCRICRVQVCLFLCHQSQEQIEEERERVNASVSVLEEELESCKDQGERWRTELQVVTEQWVPEEADSDPQPWPSSQHQHHETPNSTSATPNVLFPIVDFNEAPFSFGRKWNRPSRHPWGQNQFHFVYLFGSSSYLASNQIQSVNVSNLFWQTSNENQTRVTFFQKEIYRSIQIILSWLHLHLTII